MTQGRIMGIDHGLARVGIALSDPLRMFATPLRILTQTSRTKTISAISALVEEQSVEKIIVGLPTNADGYLSRQAEFVLEWAEALAKIVEIPILFWDESRSSIDAESLVASRSKQKSESKDDLAAAIILQEYLTALQDNDEPGQTIEAIRANQQ